MLDALSKLFRREGFHFGEQASSLQFLDGESRGERLLELLRLFAILNDQRVEIAAASHLELGVGSVLLDLDRLGILSASRQQKVFDLLNLLRHFQKFLLLQKEKFSKFRKLKF